MPGKRVIFKSGPFSLEGLYNGVSSYRGVVVTHPHPLYGGDMTNNVVESLCLAYNRCGYSSLRFNFRGVGQSEGCYDDGNGELEDLDAAVRYMTGAGIGEIDLAGYSFGSWVVARRAGTGGETGRMVMVSPPVDLFDYSDLYNTGKTMLVIAGDGDDIADWRSIKKMTPQWNPDATLMVIPGADHFYRGKTDELIRTVTAFLP